MKHKKLKFSAVILLMFGLTGLHAQESVNATGGTYSGSGGSVAYSVGQLVYQVYTGTNGSVAEGVQQPYEISTITRIEAISVDFTISTFPNPITDHLILQIEDTDGLKTQTMSYQIFDNSSKLLWNEKITSSQTRISMSNLVPAVYFVKVMEGNKDLKTFKIIKN